MTHTTQLSNDRFRELAYWIQTKVPEDQFGSTPYDKLKKLARTLLSVHKGDSHLMDLLGNEPDTHETVLTDTLIRVSRGYAKYSSCFPTISARDKAKRAKQGAKGKKSHALDWLDKCIEDHLEGIAKAEADAQEISSLERAYRAPAAELQPAKRL